ncbi:hypothetical protein D3C74_13040 [compost metagenome]
MGFRPGLFCVKPLPVAARPRAGSRRSRRSGLPARRPAGHGLECRGLDALLLSRRSVLPSTLGLLVLPHHPGEGSGSGVPGSPGLIRRAGTRVRRDPSSTERRKSWMSSTRGIAGLRICCANALPGRAGRSCTRNPGPTPLRGCVDRNTSARGAKAKRRDLRGSAGRTKPPADRCDRSHALFSVMHRFPLGNQLPLVII